MVLLNEDEYERLLNLSSVNNTYGGKPPSPPPPLTNMDYDVSKQETGKQKKEVEEPEMLETDRKANRKENMTEKMDELDTISEIEPPVLVNERTENLSSDIVASTSDDNIPCTKKVKPWLKKRKKFIK